MTTEEYVARLIANGAHVKAGVHMESPLDLGPAQGDTHPRRLDRKPIVKAIVTPPPSRRLLSRSLQVGLRGVAHSH